MRRVLAILWALLLAVPGAAEEPVILRIEVRETPQEGYLCDGAVKLGLDDVEAWFVERKAAAGKTAVRVVFRGGWGAVHGSYEAVKERCLLAGLPEPEIDRVKETMLVVDVTVEGRTTRFRCGEREVADLAGVGKWLKEQAMKAGTERICILLRGESLAIARPYLDLTDFCVKEGLPVPEMDPVLTEEEKLPRVKAGEAPPSGKVFRLEIAEDGGLRGPEGETSLGDWAKALEAAAKGIRPDHLVEHEVVVRVGSKTAWGQLQLVLSELAGLGYYRVFLEYPQGDAWQRVTFRLPVSDMTLFMFGPQSLLRVDKKSVRLHHDEAQIVMAVRIRPSERGPMVSLADKSYTLDATELRTALESQRKYVNRRGYEGATWALDAPPDFPASQLLRFVGLVNDLAGVVLVTSDKTPELTREHLDMRRLPVPPARAQGDR